MPMIRAGFSGGRASESLFAKLRMPKSIDVGPMFVGETRAVWRYLSSAC